MTPSSWERVRAALAGRDPDRVPFFLPAGLHAAREGGRTLREALRDGAALAEGQLWLRERFGHDVVSAFSYVAAEVEAFGGEAIFYDDGPPNAGEPPLADPALLARAQPPDPRTAPSLAPTLRAAGLLRTALGEEAPVLAGAVGPFSLPALLVGLPRYLEMLYGPPGPLQGLLALCEAFSTSWLAALFEAGASMVAVFEPLASPTLVERARWLASGAPALRRLIAGAGGPVIVSLASAPVGAALPDLLALGPTGLFAAAEDDLDAVRSACRGKALLLGTLSGQGLRRLAPREARAKVRALLRQVGPGGGFLLTEHHGEVPLQVPLAVLDAVAAEVRSGR